MKTARAKDPAAMPHVSVFATVFQPAFEGGPYLVVGSVRGEGTKLARPICESRLADGIAEALAQRDELAWSLCDEAQRCGYEVSDVFLE